MHSAWKCLGVGLLLLILSRESAYAQNALTWQEVRAKFEASNPSLRAAHLAVDESRAQEIIYYRPVSSSYFCPSVGNHELPA